MSLSRALATVGSLTFVSRIAGFVRDVVMSHTLGAGPLADAFFVALKLPNFFRSITAEGAFSISFVPLYTDKRIKDTQDAATAFASAAVSFMIAALLPFSVIMMWAMPVLIAAIAPGFRDDPVQFNAAVEMSRLSFPYLLLVTIAAMLGAVLNAHHKFGPYAFAPVLFNLCLIASIVFTPFFETQGHAMAVGMSVSGALQAVWVWMYVRKMGLNIRLVRPRLSPEMKTLFRRMGPGVLVASVFQINLVVNMMIGSTLTSGSISHIYYADRLYQLPFGVIGIAVGTALLPLFSAALSRGNAGETVTLYSRAMEYMILLTLPCTAGLVWAADPIVKTIYVHGAFDAMDAQATTFILMAYALGLPAYVLTRVYNAVFYAHQDTWTPVKISLVTTGLNIVGSYVLAQYLGAFGMALSTAAVGWFLLASLHHASRARQPDLHLDDRFNRALPRLFISTGLLVLFLAIFRYGFDDAFTGPLATRILPLLALGAGSIIVYGAALHITRAVSFPEFKTYFTRKGRGQNHDTNNTPPPDIGA
jgi:putative peptidoglycan lipid II flippase